jgi:hypothetical protein
MLKPELSSVWEPVWLKYLLFEPQQSVVASIVIVYLSGLFINFLFLWLFDCCIKIRMI